ncbi:kinase-like domain-containing protein, partial [Mycena rebaudengoi]
MAFDFPSYLTSRLSLEPVDFQVRILTGGLTNITVRATFASLTSLFGSPPSRSVILKYAPPHVASDPAQPMSVHRQVIEANALQYLAGSKIAALLAEFPSLRIPHLIHHDTTSNVLWISDLGETKTLSQFLCSQPAPAPTAVCDIASTLGTFIARFWAATANPTPETLAPFARLAEDQGDPAIFLASTARRVMDQYNVPDAEVLAARVAAGMQPHNKREPCLSMVDFWPGSILVNADGAGYGLVDWEYFGLSTPGSEIGMLVAHLHLIMLNSNSSADVSDTVRLFVGVFLNACLDNMLDYSPYLKRQALVAHGRELVTALEFFSSDLDEESKKRVLDAGVWNLRAVAGSEGEMEPWILNAGSISELWLMC